MIILKKNFLIIPLIAGVLFCININNNDDIKNNILEEETTSKETTSEEMTSEETTSKETTSEETTLEETTLNTISNQESNPIQIQKTEEELIKMYEEVFSDYKNIISSGYNDAYFNTEVSFLLNWYDDLELRNLGYDFIDIDGDGIQELFIGDMNEPEGKFLGCYALGWNNRIVTMFTTEERSGTTLNEDLSFYNYGALSSSEYHEYEMKFKDGKTIDYDYKFAYISGLDLNPGEVQGYYVIPVDENGLEDNTNRRFANEQDLIELDNINSKTPYKFNYKYLVETYNNEYSAYEGVNIANLNIGDVVGDFTVSSIEVDTSQNLDNDYYDSCYIELTGNYDATIRNIYIDEVSGDYGIILEESPLHINNKKLSKDESSIENFMYIWANEEMLLQFVSQDYLDSIFSTYSYTYSVDVNLPVTIKSLKHSYKVYTGGPSVFATIVPR